MPGLHAASLPTGFPAHCLLPAACLPLPADPSALAPLSCTFLFQKALSAVDASKKAGRIAISKKGACARRQMGGHDGAEACPCMRYGP